MVDRLSVLCFAGTYALALASDLTRFASRSGARWYATVGLTALGWLVHTAYLANLAYRAGDVPIASDFGSLLVLAWMLAAICLYWLVRLARPVAVGLFLLPIVLALSAVAVRLPRAEWTTPDGPIGLWGLAHGVLLLSGAVLTCVAFVTGVMYLAQARRLKAKRPPRSGLALPSLERSERWNRLAITLAFPLLTFGLAIGLAIVLATGRAGEAVLSWSDPKILSAGAMWLVFAALLHARYRPEMRGTRVMALTIVAFAFMVFALVGVDLLLPTAHGVPRPSSPAGGGAP